MKIAICVPCYGDPRAEFAFSLANVLIHSAGLDLALVWAGGSPTPRNRCQIAEQALATGADALFWLDADMRYPPDTLRRLLAHFDKTRVVGCNYARRGRPTGPTAMNLGEGHVYTTEEKARRRIVEQVDTMGLGVVLMTADVFKLIDRPWFVWDDAEGEDGFFFRKLREKGVRPFVDHQLSWEVGHVGSQVLTNADAVADHGRWVPPR